MSLTGRQLYCATANAAWNLQSCAVRGIRTREVRASNNILANGALTARLERPLLVVDDLGSVRGIK